ncbi:MAG: hypothetical protein QMC70_08755 [Bacteroidia bacterium]
MRNRPIYPFLAFDAYRSKKNELMLDLDRSSTYYVFMNDTSSANSILVNIHVNPTDHSYNNDPLHTYIL